MYREIDYRDNFIELFGYRLSMPSSPDSANAALSAPVNDSSNSRKKNVKPSVSPFVKGLGGSMGGLMEACFLQPIDVIKTRMQLDNVGKYKGIFDCGKQISVKEGVPALWKGKVKEYLFLI